MPKGTPITNFESYPPVLLEWILDDYAKTVHSNEQRLVSKNFYIRELHRALDRERNEYAFRVREIRDLNNQLIERINLLHRYLSHTQQWQRFMDFKEEEALFLLQDTSEAETVVSEIDTEDTDMEF